MQRIPGIVQFIEVTETDFTTLDDIYQKTIALVGHTIIGKTFCVRAKRIGQHDFTSTELERYVGGGLNQHVEGARVKLSRPEVTIRLEIKDEKAYIWVIGSSTHCGRAKAVTIAIQVTRARSDTSWAIPRFHMFGVEVVKGT